MVEAANVPGSLKPEETVAAYTAAVGQPFTFSRMLTGGETGATEIRLSDGTRRVLKWDADPGNVAARLRGVRLAERLREVGWPVPEQHVHRDGPWLFVAQEYLAGHKVQRIDRNFVDDVMALHPSRRDLGGSGNSRNGSSSKRVTTEIGEIVLAVPRDRAGTFEPVTVPKHQRRLDGLSGNVISLYAKGLTTGEIQAHLAEIYDTSVSLETISKITDEVVADMAAWQNRTARSGLSGAVDRRDHHQGPRRAGREPALLCGHRRGCQELATEISWRL